MLGIKINNITSTYFSYYSGCIVDRKQFLFLNNYFIQLLELKMKLNDNKI